MNLSIVFVGVIGAAIFVGVSLLVAFMLRRVVPTNMVHIVQSRKATTSYGKGRDAGNVYYQWPAFLPVIGVTVTEFPESVFSITLMDYDAYDAGRLPFKIDALSFFRVKDSDVAAHRVSHFTELEEQLRGVLQGAVRRVLATHKLEDIMEDRAGLGAAFTKEVDDQLSEWGVATAKSIEFMDIRDANGSRVIQQIMAKEQSRIDVESRTVVAKNYQEAQTREIEAKREVGIQEQLAEEAIGKRTAEKDKNVGIANEQANQQVLVEQKATAEKDMEVKQVQEVRTAEIAKQVAEVAANQEKTVTVVNAEAARQSSVIAAEATKQTTELVAQGDLAAAKNQAEGLKATGEAKATAEKLMQLAPVEAQIVLAHEIGENQSYQEYLVTIRKVEASQAVGIEMAKAIGEADLKVIANSGDIQSGVAGLGDMFSAAGGQKIAAMIEGLSQTAAGKAVVDRVTGETAAPAAVVARQTKAKPNGAAPQA